MTPEIRAVYEELLARAMRASHEERARQLRAAFAKRCGRFEPDHPSAEYRDRAAWEHVLVSGGLAAELALELDDPAEQAVALAISRAQRGVFLLNRVGAGIVAVDLWQKGEFFVMVEDDIARALSAQGQTDPAPCQGRLVATEGGCVILPGTVFHPAEARGEIEVTLAAARDRSLSTDATLDALLRMEHAFRSLSRVKVGYAYRAEALP